MDEVIEKLSDIIQEIDIDDKIVFIRKYLLKHVDRLYQLLWGFNGPFADGYQLQDWMAVTLLVSNWIMEVIADVQKFCDGFETLRNHISENPDYIPQLVCDFAYQIVNKDVLNLDDQSKIVAKFILSSKTLIPTIMRNINVLLDIIDDHCCYYCMFKSDKNIQKKLQKISQNQARQSRENAEILSTLK